MEPPSFLKKIGDCEVVTGMSAKFTACVNGVPDPEYEWFRNGKRMEPSDRFIMEAEGSGLLRLIVKDTDEADVGTYRLRIFNPYGEASCEAELRYDCECDPPAGSSPTPGGPVSPHLPYFPGAQNISIRSMTESDRNGAIRTTQRIITTSHFILSCKCTQESKRTGRTSIRVM